MAKDHTRYYETFPAEGGGIGNADLLVVDSAGNSYRFVHPTTDEFGRIATHTKSSPNPSINVGSTSPTQSGGQWDLRDSGGSKAITHIDWSGGAGQKSYDAENAVSNRFLESKNLNIESPGQLFLLGEPTYTLTDYVTGPFYSALGYLWRAKAGGGATFSADGVTFTTSTGLPSDAAVTSWTTDGRFVYASVPGGASQGVYKGTITPSPLACAFAKIGAGSTEKATRVVFHSGFFFASKDYISGSQSSQVAMLDSSATYGFSSTICTPASMGNYDTAALVQAGNAIYWVVQQGNSSYVYELSFDPDTQTLATKQYAEFPTGFIATCAVGYLSSVYVGGYWSSGYSGRGQGQVYQIDSGYASPLFAIGDRPAFTSEPTSVLNDNRIWAITAGERDIYVTTNRGMYRWDIDNGGYSHVFDLTGSGQGTQAVAWDSGSDYSWDGTDYTTTVPPHGRYPTKWVEAAVTGTPVWTHTGGIATIVSGGNVRCEITDITLVNANGNTIEVKTGPSFGDSGAGFGDSRYYGGIALTVRDGTREAVARILHGSVELHKYSEVLEWQYAWVEEWDEAEQDWARYQIWKWVPTGTYAWSYHPTETYYGWSNNAPVSGSKIVSKPPSVIYKTGARKVRFNLLTTTATLSVDDDQAGQLVTNDTQADTGADRIIIYMTMGMAMDYCYINADAAVAPTEEVEVLSMAGLASHNGVLYTPYSIPSVLATPTETNARGYAYMSNIKAASGYVIQSDSSFHTGSLMKDFRYVDISHEPLSAGAHLECTVYIDGEAIVLTGEEGFTCTRFPIDRSGYSIRTKVTLYRGTVAKRQRVVTPVVTAINVIWDFIKIAKHTYVLDCRAGAKNGAWTVDPTTAIDFIWSVADKRARFQDAFSNSYNGVIEEIVFMKAQRSLREGNGGIVQIVVREE